MGSLTAHYKWPLATLDIEASSLDQDSYPIEIGVAMQLEPGGFISVWSTLIHPTWEWSINGHWSKTSAKVHGLSIEQVRKGGRPSIEVATELNSRLEGLTAYCDEILFDAYWLARLFDSTDIKQRFALAAFFPTTSTTLETTRGTLGEQTPKHRAQADAERLLLALIQAITTDRERPSEQH